MSTNQPLPVAYAFTNNGVFDSNDGVTFVTGVDTAGNLTTTTAASLGMRVVVSSNQIFIGNSSSYWTITPPTPAEISAGYFLAANGTWTGGTGGGGATVGGVNTSIQYNLQGTLTGDSSLLWNPNNQTLYLGTGYLNPTTYSGTANSALFVGGVSAANVVSNAQLQANLVPYVNTSQLSGNLASYTPTSGIPAIVGNNTANNTAWVGSVSAPNVVSNSQLQANLANYPNNAQLSANLANYPNNTQMQANISALGITPWKVETANYTATNGDRLFCDTSNGSFVVTLPLLATNGFSVSFCDAANTWSGNNLTIDPNGSQIAGSSANLVCDQSAEFALLYTKNGWEVTGITAPTGASPSGAVVYNTAQSLTPSQEFQAQQNIGFSTHFGCGILTCQSATQLTFLPRNGNSIRIAGEVYQIPNGGVSITNSGLTASTKYYIYAYVSGGSLALTASTTIHATDTTAGNAGIEIMSGNNAYSLIGMVIINGSGQFEDSPQVRYVRSWFNEYGVTSYAVDTAEVAFSYTSPAEISTNCRCFIALWNGENFNQRVDVAVNNNTSGNLTYVIGGYNGSTGGEYAFSSLNAVSGWWQMIGTSWAGEAGSDAGYTFEMFGLVAGGTAQYYYKTMTVSTSRR